MAKPHPRIATWNTYLLDFPWRHHQGKWISLEGKKNYHSHKWESCSTQAASCKPPRTVNILAQSQSNHVLTWNIWPDPWACYQLPKCLKFFNSSHKQSPSHQMGHEVLLGLWGKLATEIVFILKTVYTELWWIITPDSQLYTNWTGWQPNMWQARYPHI